MGILNWIIAAGVLISPWRKQLWPIAVLSILADPPTNYVSVYDIPGVEKLIERWKEYYTAKGYSEDFVDAAIAWAIRTAEGYVNKVFEDLPREEKIRILRDALEFYLKKAEDWMQGFLELVKTVKTAFEAKKPSIREVETRIPTAPKAAVMATA